MSTLFPAPGASPFSPAPSSTPTGVTPARSSVLDSISASPALARAVQARVRDLFSQRPGGGRKIAVFVRISDSPAQGALLLLLGAAIAIVRKTRPSLRRELRARLILRNGRFEKRPPDEFNTETRVGRAVERASLLLARLVGGHINRRRDAFDAAMLARLEVLLHKHEGELYADWQKHRGAQPQDSVPARRALFLASLVLAVSPSVLRRWPDAFPSDKSQKALSDTATPEGRAFARNERLLCNLVYRGILRRGELGPLG